MENKQKINCTVESCIYNNPEYGLCKLNSIIVTPKTNVNMCGFRSTIGIILIPLTPYSPDDNICRLYLG